MGDTLYRSILDSPLGPLELISSAKGLVELRMGRAKRQRHEVWLRRHFPGAELIDAGGRHRSFCRQVREYFEGRRRLFDLPVDLRGTAFQRAVWTQVARIPFGCTATYGAIAHLTGSPRSARAVGAANGANPVPLIIPCHRVLGSDGSLTGYGGGLWRKRWLLAHEGVLGVEPVQIGLFRRPLDAEGRSSTLPGVE